MLIHPRHCRGKDFWYGFWHRSGSKHSLSRSRHQLHKQCLMSAQQVCALCLQWAGRPRSAPCTWLCPIAQLPAVTGTQLAQGPAHSTSALCCCTAARGGRFSPVPECAGTAWGRAEEPLAGLFGAPSDEGHVPVPVIPSTHVSQQKARTLSQSYAAMIHPLQEFGLKAKIPTTKRSFNLQAGGRGTHGASCCRTQGSHAQAGQALPNHDFPFWRCRKIP